MQSQKRKSYVPELEARIKQLEKENKEKDNEIKILEGRYRNAVTFVNNMFTQFKDFLQSDHANYTERQRASSFSNMNKVLNA